MNELMSKIFCDSCLAKARTLLQTENMTYENMTLSIKHTASRENCRVLKNLIFQYATG